MKKPIQMRIGYSVEKIKGRLL